MKKKIICIIFILFLLVCPSVDTVFATSIYDPVFDFYDGVFDVIEDGFDPLDKSNTDDSIFETDEYGCPIALKPIILFVKKIAFNTLQFFVPILLILMGTIDFVKATAAMDEKGNKEAVSKFIKRCIAAILVFFVTTIVSLVIGLFAKTDVGEQSGWMSCWQNID